LSFQIPLGVGVVGVYNNGFSAKITGIWVAGWPGTNDVFVSHLLRNRDAELMGIKDSR
jgi:hypothetical protein